MLYNMLCTGRLLDPPDAESASLFTASKHLIQEQLRKYQNGGAELKDLIQQILQYPDFDPEDVVHNMHQRLMLAIEEGNIEVIDLWEDGDGNRDVRLYKRPALNVLRVRAALGRAIGWVPALWFQPVQELTRLPRSGL